MNSLPRISWRALQSNASSWACTSCRQQLARARQLPIRTARRPISNPTKARQDQATAPSMDRLREHYKYKNRTTMFYTLSIILGTVAFSYGSVPMYKMICQTTGWGGQPIKAPGHGGSSDGDPASRLVPVKDARRIRVTFNASVSDILPWKFVPQQREVRVLPGETALAFYTATNRSDSDIIGVATYSVTPAQVAPYFSKIQCFCFEEQRLNAGETVDMPVFFYLDPDLLDDLNMRGINEVTLSYTFFTTTRLRRTFAYPSDTTTTSPASDSDSEGWALDEQEQEDLIQGLAQQNAARNAQFRLFLLALPSLSTIPYLMVLSTLVLPGNGSRRSAADIWIALLALSSLASTAWTLWSLPPGVTGIRALDAWVGSGDAAEASGNTTHPLGPIGANAQRRRRASAGGSRFFLWAQRHRSPLEQYLPFLNVAICGLLVLAGLLSPRRSAAAQHWGHIGLANLPAVIYAVVLIAKTLMGSIDPEKELSALRYEYKGA
ncbi:hypothetical protein GQX73_g3135 [Xylaria multiplex]|uniref:Cytochrome c oxidase assembly protein CtaG/Cox11 n=1 Tax=Xylaria multiplex TaxID=323545 RepID=A0A7C8MTV4_9PEZI|nr:hypothetical protein GQX73_g3135 [Xylaria multiplex]